VPARRVAPLAEKISRSQLMNWIAVAAWQDGLYFLRDDGAVFKMTKDYDGREIFFHVFDLPRDR
jgi:hypothetical protein